MGDLTHVSCSLSELKAHPSNKHICLQRWTHMCEPPITVTSGPLPSRAGLNIVIWYNMDHLWRRLTVSLLFDSKLCFMLNSVFLTGLRCWSIRVGIAGTALKLSWDDTYLRAEVLEVKHVLNKLTRHGHDENCQVLGYVCLKRRV